ncbi:hypothetical protein GCM10017687_19840 [Streptomyces echinatus]
MREFGYRRATDVAGAVALLGADPDARFLGGGTNLVDLMKSGVERPARLVDIRGLPLDGIESTPEGGLRIGATVTNGDLAAHPEVRRRYPALAQAVLAGASGQLRNMATVGGNLLQRTRCGYFTDVTRPCNKRVPGSGCPAVAGEHHNHAILGASGHCVAVHPSDMAVALTAFDATVHFETADGAGELPLAGFYLPVGDTPHRETALPPGALITAITLPPAPGRRQLPLPQGARAGLVRVRHRLGRRRAGGPGRRRPGGAPGPGRRRLPSVAGRRRPSAS